MPRHGNTRRPRGNKHQGHRMHRKARAARVKARAGRPVGWSPGMRWDDSLGQWVL